MNACCSAIVACAFAAALVAHADSADLSQRADPYYTSAQDQLRNKLMQAPIKTRARNIILFVGDGMGITTMTAARIYQGQGRNQDGVSNKLAFETLPYSAFSRTYSHDSQVTDSAPSAAAMTTGVKSRNGTLGVSANVALNDCAAGLQNSVTTIAELAEMAGMSTGAVTTTPVTDATPAATYAHSAHRAWQSDADLSNDARQHGCSDIARQLVELEYGDGIDVVMGGGRDRFIPSTMADPEYPDMKGKRTDGRNLIEMWQSRYRGEAQFVWNLEEFNALPRTTSKVLGLFEPGNMRFEADRGQDKSGEPSLAQMTVKAIAILERNPNGYFLLVEGGRIDHAHHAGMARLALEDTLAFDDAVRAALGATNRRDTLIIVTADHSHVLSMSGYPSRSNPILGLNDNSTGRPHRAKDGKPHTTLSYANGPGASGEGARADLSNADTAALNFVQQALVSLDNETHGGEDVAIFAGGPWAHLFSGAVDQHFIFHVMNHAAALERRAAKAGAAP